MLRLGSVMVFSLACGAVWAEELQDNAGSVVPASSAGNTATADSNASTADGKADSDITSDSESSALDSLETLLPESGEAKRQKLEVETISEDEIKPALRKLPQLVEKIQVEEAAANSPFLLLPHRPNYILPFTYYSNPSNYERDRILQHYSGDDDATLEDGNDHIEAVFQISIKVQLASGIIGKLSTLSVGYTNRSFWQAYNSDISRPFRETNHEPELMLNWQTKNNWIDAFGVSLNHQSNGQTSSMSRSWNRIIFSALSVTDYAVVSGKLWWRIPEESDSDPWDPEDNDNPDIDDYMGPGELTLRFMPGNQTIDVTVRNNFNPDENRGALQLEWTFPMTKKIKGYGFFFDGYGDSLIDYNHYQQRIGLGIKLSDWF